MDPIKIIAYVAVAAVVALVALGGLAFYAGYTAGLGGPDTARQASLGDAGEDTVAQVRELNAQIAELKQALSSQAATSAAQDASAERISALSAELAEARREIDQSRSEAEALRERLAELEAAQAADAPGDVASAEAQTTTGDLSAVVLYDRFQLRRETSRDFNDVDLQFALQTVGSRSAGLSINGQRISMQTRDGKQIIHKGVTCELILIETNPSEQLAQFSIACKR
jgi:uncharacterized coiled-coil protein SlyX